MITHPIDAGSWTWWFIVANQKSNVISYDVSSDSTTNQDQHVYVLEDDGTIVSQENEVDLTKLVQAFYQRYPNKVHYDFLTFLSTFNDPTKAHHHIQVKNTDTGIGMYQFDQNAYYGSKNLLGFNWMNATYNTDDFVRDKDLIKRNLRVLTHEMMHQWVLYIGDTISCGASLPCQYDDLKFRSDDASHYSRWANSGFVRNGQQWDDENGGFIWKDNQDGTFSIVVNGSLDYRGISPLSLYLMGLAPADRVPDFTFIKPDNPNDYSSPTISGTIRTLPLSELTSLYGQRNPNYGASKKNYTMGYVLLVKKGSQASADQLAAAKYIAEKYPDVWNYQTQYQSTINGIGELKPNQFE